MSLCRYLPVPSDRMGVIWTLLSLKDAVVLEYGPAGTTHYSVGMYSAMGVEPAQSLFTTHLGEDDIIMGDVTRLEEAIREIDTAYKPKIIFIVASAVTSIIGTDIKGVCNYMQNEVNAKLITVDTGGFKGDYTLGMKEGYNLIVNTLVCDAAVKEKNTYNILGASGYSYRMKSDLWEINSLIEEAFSYKLNSILGINSSISAIENLGAAEINLVLRAEALPAAEYLKEKFGTPYVYGMPYGYSGTHNWLDNISKLINVPVADGLIRKLKMRMMGSAGYKMYASMYQSKGKSPKAVIIGDYDQIKGFSKIFEEINLPVELKISAHSLSGLEAEDIVKPDTEKEKIELLKSVHHGIVLGDEVSLYLCDADCEKIVTAFPIVYQSQTAEHLPFAGIRGMDYILEAVDRYYSKL